MINRNGNGFSSALPLRAVKEICSGFLFVGAFIAGNASATCWESAAGRYKVDPPLLKAIAWKESRGRTDAVGPLLSDGNRAHGAMQINTIHLPDLKRSSITKKDLHDACVSVEVGAWALAKCIAKFGETWKAVGCYNTGPASNNVDAQERYVRDVKRYYEGFQQQQGRRNTQSQTLRKKG